MNHEKNNERKNYNFYEYFDRDLPFVNKAFHMGARIEKINVKFHKIRLKHKIFRILPVFSQFS